MPLSSDITLTLVLAALAGLAMIVAAGLKGFSLWIDLQRTRLAEPGPSAPTMTGNRIELADLKERLRKLEAIAAGVDL